MQEAGLFCLPELLTQRGMQEDILSGCDIRGDVLCSIRGHKNELYAKLSAHFSYPTWVYIKVVNI